LCSGWGMVVTGNHGLDLRAAPGTSVNLFEHQYMGDEIRIAQKPSNMYLHPSDFDEMGCSQNGKTCPVAPIMGLCPKRPNERQHFGFSEVITSR
jgi:hypothetical protein